MRGTSLFMVVVVGFGVPLWAVTALNQAWKHFTNEFLSNWILIPLFVVVLTAWLYAYALWATRNPGRERFQA